MFGTIVGSDKQRRVVVEFDPAVIDEARQTSPVRERVADGGGKLDLLA